jgi:hypothetical protein
MKAAIRHWLDHHPDVEPVPPKTESSRQVQLSVWRTRAKRRPIGLEFGHSERLNIWLGPLGYARELPPSVEVVRKEWDPRRSRWTDAQDDGADSNLKGYDEFRGKNVYRIGAVNLSDARAVLKKVLS